MTKPAMTWTGRILSAIPVLMMTMSGVMKLAHSQEVVQGFGQFGFAESLLTPIGLIELACVAVYLIPRTALLGAMLMVGYLGGAVVTHLRAGELAALAPFVLGIIAVGGVWMRDPRLRELLPLRRDLGASDAAAHERRRSSASASGSTATPLGSR